MMAKQSRNDLIGLALHFTQHLPLPSAHRQLSLISGSARKFFSFEICCFINMNLQNAKSFIKLLYEKKKSSKKALCM